MCYTAPLSLAAFSIVTSGVVLLAIRNKYHDRAIGLVLMGLTSMQLCEFIIHLDPDCVTGLNKIGSFLAQLSVFLVQPVCSLLAVLLFAKVKHKPLLKTWYAVFLAHIVLNFQNLKDIECSFRTCPDEWRCGLETQKVRWTHHPCYMLLVFLLPVLMSDMQNKAVWIGVSTLGYAFLAALMKKGIGSLWCFYGPFLVLALVAFIPT